MADDSLTVEQIDRLIQEYYDSLGSAEEDCVGGIMDAIGGLEDMRAEKVKENALASRQ